MIRRSLPTLALSAVLAFAAGCGGGKSSTSTATPPPAATAGSTTTSAAPQLTVPSSVTNAAVVQRAVAACRSLVKATPTLSSEARSKVEGICDKAAHGDIAGARKAAKEACTEIINGTPALKGALKERALASCQAVK